MADLRQALSRDNPWPGLDPFDEADQEFFHGRAAESEELLRRVRRAPLTVLFGRSGFGKTSLLKAGLFPRLRAEDALPVYVRLDHADGAPSLRQQIYLGLQAECEANRIQASLPLRDESLWSFFHRRDAEFWSERNCPVTPVVVFDQFEEIFTLGQKTEAAQHRSAAFLAELSDLIENRPSDAVKQALETDPTAARRFDFKRFTSKIILSFREDFLAEMEGLKDGTPSLMYNRFRLLAMNGFQAYEVITQAGGTLVDDDVARRILRLAWKNEPSPSVEQSDFSKIEIDPALLSVVCTELNHKRRQATPPPKRITPDLLEGADREILSGFYERVMADLDPRVRAFVEDELITEDGDHRDSYAWDDALKRPGVTSEALDALIRRRLLRADERRGVSRLELPHDVLTSVVKVSRDNRRARETVEMALAQQRLNRRRGALLLAGVGVVTVLSVLAGLFAWDRSRLVREAETTRLSAKADQLEDVNYDTSLLVNREEIRTASALDTSAGLLRRFMSHPYLYAFLPGHKDVVRGVAFSPTGKLLASASRDNTVILWDVNKRKPLATLKGHHDGVNSVTFSPDGKLLASASRDNVVILWDVDRRKAVATLEGNLDWVVSVAFSPDGRQLASSSTDGAIILWDVRTHKSLATLQERQKVQVSNVGYSPDDKQFRDEDAQPTLSTLQEVQKFQVSSVAFSPDGKRLASASENRTVILWDVDSRTKLATLEGHKDAVLSVTFSPDGKRLASASADETVILWDVDARTKLATLEGHKNAVLSVTFSPDGKRLASASADKTVILWDVYAHTFSNLYAPTKLATLEGHKDAVLGVAFSPDGKQLASASADGTIILWDLDRHKATATLEGHEATVYGLAFSPNGKRLASGSWDGTVILWDMDKRTPIISRDAVNGIAFSPDGKRLAAASRDNTVILWDLDSRKLIAMKGHHGVVYRVVFSPDGKRLASASQDKTVILWDVNSQKPIATLVGHTNEVKGVAFSPDGKQLASASDDKTVILWDLDSLKPIATLGDRKAQFHSVAFSPDSKLLASASQDKAVILWDVDSYKKIATLEGHQDAVFDVAFSWDGKRLASASRDKTVILWDVDSHQMLATLEGHKGTVYGVAFSPDGKRLASASQDKTVIIWDLDPKDLMVDACRTANRNLTCEEWRNYIDSNKPYQKTCPELPGPPEACN